MYATRALFIKSKQKMLAKCCVGREQRSRATAQLIRAGHLWSRESDVEPDILKE